MVDLVILDGSPANGSKCRETDPKSSERSDKKSLKRKRALFDVIGSGEKKESVIAGYRQEIDGLFRYFNDVLAQKVHLDDVGCCSTNSVIACLLEERRLPYSKLVEEIYEKLKDRVTLASVRSSVLFIGQRSMHGIGNADADVLEDESESCLWCWETRDMKLLPETQRGILKTRRICRKKIHERITALSAMILNLSKAENHPNIKLDLRKASEKLGKTFSETQIRSLIESLLQKQGAEIAEKEAKLKEKELANESEKKKREVEKEKKKMDRELQKEKWQSERELKRLQDEAEKEERRREKEEAELRKQLKKQQDEAEKDQRRREKEEAELKKQLAVQKQASIMERFLKSKKNNVDIQDARSSTETSELYSSGKSKEIVNPVTLSMDGVFSQKDGVETHGLLRSHLVSWHKLSESIQCNKSHWGVRRKPKVALFTELKLQGSSFEGEPSGKVTPTKRHDCSEVKDGNDLSLEKLVDRWEETVANDRSCHNSIDIPLRDILLRTTKKLLQFDKSHRPAYYGTLSSKSDVVGPRKPFNKDPNLDYDIDSDEEWEEEDPGENLSDCDKDDEEENLEEGNLKDEDEDEDGSEGSFLVPDGYLSENEGVQVDRMVSNASDEEARSSPMQEVENEEFRVFLRQQKYFHDLTEHAIRRNQPLIISNLKHEKASLRMAEDLSGTPKLEQICLQALSMRSCLGGSSIEISADPTSLTEDKEYCQLQNQTDTSSAVPAAVVLDLREVVSSIQSCPQGINKVVESLQKKFPVVPKTQLRSKVREVSSFVDNRWQVKKEILDKLGLSMSPENTIGRTKGIASFFLKRCLPPACETINAAESSPQTCLKPVINLDEPESVENQL